VNDFSFTTSADTTVCIGGTASLSVFPDNVPVGPLTFYWEAGQGLGENYTFNPNVSIDNITVYAQYGSNCFTETEVITVELYDPLQLAILENETICLGDTIALDVEGIGGGLEPYNYVWTTDGNVFSFDQVPVVQPDLPTQYCLTLSDACETPEVTECVQISLEPIIFPGFGADVTEDCFPLLVNFEGVAGDDDLIAGAEWDFGDGIHNFSIGSAAHNYLSPGYYDVSYTIVSTAGCVYADTLLNYIHAAPYPNAAFNTDPETAVLPNTTFDFNNLSFDNEFNFWTFGEFGFSEDMEPEFTFPVNVPTQIEVWLFVENEFGCRDSLSRDLLILEEFTLYVPTAFTPDGDGINDFFGIEGVDIDPDYFELRIWDRWGELVYESFDLKQRWIGNFQNGDHFVPDGMYVYQLEAQSLTTGDKKHIFGHVTIVR
jgi:large repetitive protein